MAEIKLPDPVMLVVAAFSRCEEALDWAEGALVERYGPLKLKSPRFEFRETDHYTASMGAELRKQFLAFERLIRPEELAEIKHATNALEAQFAGEHPQDVPRPLNLDPGCLSLGKFVLASTKDHMHRVYLEGGIYAEVTLHFTAGDFVPWPWTYPDYRREDYRAFLRSAREEYRRLLRG